MADFFQSQLKDGTSDNVLSVNHLHHTRLKRLENRQKVYDKVLDKCGNRINYFNKYLYRDSCLFEIPEYVFGLPSFDVRKCTAYIMVELRKKGYICEYQPQRVSYEEDAKVVPCLYISWNIRKTKGKERLALEMPRDDRYVFEKNGPSTKEYVFEKPKIEYGLPDFSESDNDYPRSLSYNPSSALDSLKFRADLIRQSKAGKF